MFCLCSIARVAPQAHSPGSTKGGPKEIFLCVQDFQSAGSSWGQGMGAGVTALLEPPGACAEGPAQTYPVGLWGVFSSGQISGPQSKQAQALRSIWR